MAPRVVLVGGDGDRMLERLWVERALGGEWELVDGDDASTARVAQLLDASEASTALVHFDARSQHERVGLVSGLLAAKPDLWVVALGEDDDKRVMLAAIRAGAR